MQTTLTTKAHTGADGTFSLMVPVGVPDADVSVTVLVQSVAPDEVDDNGWPIGYFERFAGCMPWMTRAPQGEPEERLPFE